MSVVSSSPWEHPPLPGFWPLPFPLASSSVLASWDWVSSGRSPETAWAPCTREALTCQPSAVELGTSVSSMRRPLPRRGVLRTVAPRPSPHSLSAERGAADQQSSLFGNQLRSGRATLSSLFGATGTGLEEEELAWELVLWGSSETPQGEYEVIETAGCPVDHFVVCSPRQTLVFSSVKWGL